MSLFLKTGDSSANLFLLKLTNRDTIAQVVDYKFYGFGGEYV